MKKIFILLSSIIILTIGLSESCEIYVTGYSESYTSSPYFDLDVDFGSGWENINDVENYLDNVLDEGYGNDMELSATLEPGIYEFGLDMDGNGHAYMSLTIAGVEYILESHGMWDYNEITITVDGDVCQVFNLGYAAGAASVTSEDELTQADIDAAYAEGAASVTCEDEITQADIDAAYAEGAASVTPDDGITQEDVDAAAMESYILGAQSGDISGDDNLNVTDIIMYIEKILED